MSWTPDEFWKRYAKELVQYPGGLAKLRELYRTLGPWTLWTEEVAEHVIRDLELLHNCWLRLDACGYQGIERHNFHIRIAYEHEHDDQWEYEICKLSHVWADLRVLVGYWDFRNGGRQKLEAKIKDVLKIMEDDGARITRIPRKWLFIFGPRDRSVDPNYPYVAYELDPRAGNAFALIPILQPVLNPDDWLQSANAG